MLTLNNTKKNHYKKNLQILDEPFWLATKTKFLHNLSFIFSYLVFSFFSFPCQPVDYLFSLFSFPYKYPHEVTYLHLLTYLYHTGH